MAKGFDCAAPLTKTLAKRFREDGYEFVCRYLVPSGWKRLTRAEAAAISAAGLQIVSVYETTASRALGGRDAGLADGAAAAQTAIAVGQPEGSRIYFAVDFDASASQMASVIQYIKAAGEASPKFRTGVYGSAAVVEAVMAAKACTGFWQTYAWSRGRKAEGIHIYQYDNGPKGLGQPIHGVNVDMNLSSGDAGWWNTLTTVPSPPTSSSGGVKEYMLVKEDANKIIAFIKAAYMAAGSPESREEFHRLADEIRKASGQAVEGEK
ncbi:glycoside hydrolase domain-containing protein [Paenibacillus sp. sgz5001063]|uniref:glycoside hydrolase domain-containing protein n=1 Tax=Paenibacillus sp. sgz5001063 TaxID=3242474 RepID=UPI0036D266D0